jgi:hypothetical protein
MTYHCLKSEALLIIPSQSIRCYGIEHIGGPGPKRHREECVHPLGLLPTLKEPLLRRKPEHELVRHVASAIHNHTAPRHLRWWFKGWWGVGAALGWRVSIAMVALVGGGGGGGGGGVL